MSRFHHSAKNRAMLTNAVQFEWLPIEYKATFWMEDNVSKPEVLRHLLNEFIICFNPANLTGQLVKVWF